MTKKKRLNMLKYVIIWYLSTLKIGTFYVRFVWSGERFPHDNNTYIDLKCKALVLFLAYLVLKSAEFSPRI